MKVNLLVINTLKRRRWLELVIYFVCASVAGYYLEVVWQLFRYNFNDPGHTFGQLLQVPVAEPYGLGAVAIILLVAPLAAKHHYGLMKTYILNTVVAATIEYICAITLVLVFGRNAFWDYSSYPFNVQGYICLETSLLFGAAATVFLKAVYPKSERLLVRMTDDRIALVTATLVLVYVVCFILSNRI